MIRGMYKIGNVAIGEIRNKHIDELAGFVNSNSDQRHESKLLK